MAIFKIKAKNATIKPVFCSGILYRASSSTSYWRTLKCLKWSCCKNQLQSRCVVSWVSYTIGSNVTVNIFLYCKLVFYLVNYYVGLWLINPSKVFLIGIFLRNHITCVLYFLVHLTLVIWLCSLITKLECIK